MSYVKNQKQIISSIQNLDYRIELKYFIQVVIKQNPEYFLIIFYEILSYKS